MKRVNERIMCLKLKVLISDKLMTCICAYVPQTGRSAEEKDCFWDPSHKFVSNSRVSCYLRDVVNAVYATAT